MKNKIKPGVGWAWATKTSTTEEFKLGYHVDPFNKMGDDKPPSPGALRVQVAIVPISEWKRVQLKAKL